VTREKDPEPSGQPTPPRVARRKLLQAAATLPAVAAIPAAVAGTTRPASAAPVVAAAPPGPAPWFGVTLPPPFVPHAPQVTIGARGPHPALVPPGEGRHKEFEGETIRKDLEKIIGFSKKSRTSREVGNGQFWGRITGLPSGQAVIEWAAKQFRDAGIRDVEVQAFNQDAGAAQYLPETWEVRLLGDPAFGAGTDDVVLTSALPLPPSVIAGGELTAPLAYVGTGRVSELVDADVAGKVVIQHMVPQGHTFFERADLVAAARELVARGAVAVLNVLKMPGNMRENDFGDLGAPAFNLGGQDGLFLEKVMDAATKAGVLEKMKVRLQLRSTEVAGLIGRNAVGIVPGASKECIVIDAHADAWFDGANDNGDGLAVMVALAKHFAKPQNRPGRTLVFLASAGHHTDGLSGPRAFLAMNPELVERAVMIINVEHVAARNVGLERATYADGYRKWVADSGETPIVAGIDNMAPYLNELFDRGTQRYGVNFVSQASPTQSGESGTFATTDAASVMLIQSNVFYHSTGDVLELISTPGLERMARFLGWFITETGTAPRRKILPPPAA
jgi:hypothetical protein